MGLLRELCVLLEEVRDIRSEKEPEITKSLEKFATKHRMTLDWLHVDPQDFVQDMWQNIMTRKGLDQYDPAKGQNLESLVYAMANNHLTDLKRAKHAKSRVDPSGKPIEPVSLDAPAEPGGDTSMMDVLTARVGSRQALLDMIERIPNEKISPNYDLTWRQLFEMSFELEPQEIADAFGISASRISNLQRELVKMIRKSA